jgi:hypothetical protein
MPLPLESIQRINAFMQEASRTATYYKLEILPNPAWFCVVRREFVALSNRTHGRWPGRKALRRIARIAKCRVKDVDASLHVWPLIAWETQEMERMGR